MALALYAIGLLLLAVGFVGLLVPILPGAPLMFLGIPTTSRASVPGSSASPLGSRG
jgi:uncharacterized protein YqgC (DUF456 family)